MCESEPEYELEFELPFADADESRMYEDLALGFDEFIEQEEHEWTWKASQCSLTWSQKGGWRVMNNHQLCCWKNTVTSKFGPALGQWMWNNGNAWQRSTLNVRRKRVKADTAAAVAPANARPKNMNFYSERK